MCSSDLFTVRTVDAQSLAEGLGDADLLVIGDVERLGPRELQQTLDFHRAGGGLLLAPGPHADREAWSLLLEQLGCGRLGDDSPAAAGASWRLLRAVAGHAVLDGFPARPGEPLTQARFSAVPTFTPRAGARVLLRFDEAHPALIEAPHVLTLLAPIDAARGDLALSGAFLPLVHQMALVLARGTAAPSLHPGDTWQAPASAEWRLEDETGRAVAVRVTTTDGATLATSAPLDRPGLYRAFADGALRTSFAVNPDPRESDLTPLAERALVTAFPSGRARVLRPGDDLAVRVREARNGRELWREFVLLALVLLVAEAILGRWGMTGAARRPE